ncbi:MAG: type I 3-dehydroquinate dehydratase [Ruminococcaceae bacterium]|nr:type I 3-dehydroquinate dehydratase [Oscillospiraceae bacterium]
MMKKASFLNRERRLLVAMIQEETPEKIKCMILNSLYDGADAFGIQLCSLKPEYRNLETLRKIFEMCEGRPIYITSYRGKYNADLTDEERVELLRMGLEAGATLCDVMGDLYDPTPDQLTFDPIAVQRQSELIKTIHEKGGEVLMSTHTSRFFDEEEVLRYAKEQVARGADVVKIVSKANSEDEQMAALQIIHRLKKELDRPFLFLVGGTHKQLVRQIGPALGCCMYLCVAHYVPTSTLAQPQLRAVKAIRDAMLL